MTYLTLSLECECGKAAGSVQEVGFTNDHQLIVRWRCTKCRKYAYVLKPLSECWKECPVGPACDEILQAHLENVQEDDAKFLQAIGVRFPE